MSKIEVLEAGALTTVQDLGRPGHATLGVSASGAADPVSLRLGNLLVGNAPGAAALEMTLVGGAFTFDARVTVALTGSDFGAAVDGRPLAPWTAIPIERGSVLRLGPTRSGARSYLCVGGGIRVPLVLGSASTHLATGLGGHEGRALRAGDGLEIGRDAAGAPCQLLVPVDRVVSILFRRVLRTTPGPQRAWFAPESVQDLESVMWEVTEAADRMGLRLRGPSIRRTDPTQLLTEGVCLGAIQVPESGEPIVLFVEQQTTGGYPKIANVVRADLPALGQLRPRDRVRFEKTTHRKALALAAEQDALLARAVGPP